MITAKKDYPANGMRFKGTAGLQERLKRERTEEEKTQGYKWRNSLSSRQKMFWTNKTIELVGCKAGRIEAFIIMKEDWAGTFKQDSFLPEDTQPCVGGLGAALESSPTKDLVRITTKHESSRYSMPVFLSRGNRFVPYKDGLEMFIVMLGTNKHEIAEECGVSVRTVEGWLQGKMPTAAAMNVLRDWAE